MVYIRPCQSGRSLEAIPERKLELDIDALEERLVADGWTCIVNAGLLLVVRKECEATIYTTGKIVMKTQDGRLAQSIWDQVSPRFAAPGSS